MMRNLLKKKILLFAPSFFDYEKEIVLKLEQMGASVDYYEERPAIDFFTRLCIKLSKDLLKRKIKSYYHNILQKICTTEYDIVLIVNIDAMTVSVLEKLKYQQKNARFILYMWDSLKRKKNILDTLPLFDKILSFDKIDAEQHNIEFRPLFFLDQYSQLSRSTITDIDLCFIGSVHSDRFDFLKKVQIQSEKLGFRCYFFMFFYSPILFWIKKIWDKNFRTVKINDFQFRPLSKNEILNTICNSKVILDIQHPHQTGLTMRSIEMLGAQKKIITTNQHIKEYDFYNENNISVIDRVSPTVDACFFSSPYHQIDENIYKKYSIESWINDILT